MGLQQFERRLERLVEGVFAKAFRSGLQPVEVGRRVTREMDLRRTVGVNGMIAPNRFTVALSRSDTERFSSFADALLRELGDAVREHAKTEGYSFVGPVEVELTTDESLGAGEFLVAGETVEGAGGLPVGSITVEGRRIVIAEEPIAIGRLPECDIVLNDPNVSRRHAEVRRRGNDFVVVDLGSTNGTKVNGAGVKERRLDDGDEIRIGNTTMRFQAS